MSTHSISLAASSRPKIHRRPPASVLPGKTSSSRKAFPAKVSRLRGMRISALNVVIIGMLLAMVAFNGINLLSDRSVSSVLAAVSKHGPVSDAQAAAYYETVAPAAGSSPVQPIRLEDQAGGGVIVGQFAKIPPHNEDITEVRHVYPVDKQAARELLSIIAKY